IRDKLVTGVQTCALPISRDRIGERIRERAHHVIHSVPPNAVELLGSGCRMSAPEGIGRLARDRTGKMARSSRGSNTGPTVGRSRSEERRVGKECRYGLWR